MYPISQPSLLKTLKYYWNRMRRNACWRRARYAIFRVNTSPILEPGIGIFKLLISAMLKASDRITPTP